MMLNKAVLPHNSSSSKYLTSAEFFVFLFFLNEAHIIWKFYLTLSLHTVTNGWRLQVGDQAYRHTHREEVICYPQGIYHNIPSPSKLFI